MKTADRKSLLKLHDTEVAKARAIQVARHKCYAAFAEYSKLLPPQPKPKGKPTIAPTLQWADPESFRRGYNMTLSCWTGPGIGKIPVLVVPLDKCDHFKTP